MFLSSMPSFLRLAITAVIAVAAAWRAAFTVLAVETTPRRRSAMSGLMITEPVPLTVMVFSGVVEPVVSTARPDRAARSGPARIAVRSPRAMPAASHALLALGTGSEIETVRGERGGIADIW